MKVKSFMEKSLIGGIYLANLKVVSLLERKLKKSGLHFLEALVLAALFFEDSEEKIGPGRLAHNLGIKRSRVSQLLKELEGEGWVKRVIRPGDSRSFILVLSAAGQKKAVEAVKVLDGLDEEIDVCLGTGTAGKANRALMLVAGMGLGGV